MPAVGWLQVRIRGMIVTNTAVTFLPATGLSGTGI
jgi:hypothetical protein